MILTIVAIVANVIGAMMAAPQFIRLYRTRITDGISAEWVAMSLALNAWWAIYAIAQGLWLVLPVSVISAVLYFGIAVLFIRSRRLATRFAITLVVIGAVPLPVLAVAGWSAAGVVVGLGYACQLMPALLVALRSRELSGIAAGTWWIATGEALLWLVYGVGVGDLALAVAGASGTLVAAAILVRLQVTGHRPTLALAVGNRNRVTMVRAET
ncbi:MAG: PQ-loop domain-containing transporter [Actinomycetota bacterium]